MFLLVASLVLRVVTIHYATLKGLQPATDQREALCFCFPCKLLCFSTLESNTVERLAVVPAVSVTSSCFYRRATRNAGQPNKKNSSNTMFKTVRAGNIIRP